MAVTRVFDPVIGDRLIPGGTHNLAATVDPTAANDGTQGYAPGSFWLNTTNSRVWMNLTNATGAAVWALDGVVPGVGVEPANMVTQFGGGTASFYEEGNIVRTVSGAGVSPGSTGNDNVLATYTLPAGTFDIAGRGLNILAAGSFANNVNAKRVKLWWGVTTATVGSAIVGGTLIADTGSYTTTGAVGWQIEANVFKYGAAASNTQMAFHVSAQMGSTVGALVVPTALTSTEANAIIIAVTGNATTTASDIVLNFWELNAMN